MEENLKQQFVQHTKGICNTPSEIACEDDELEVCEGMVNVGGELQPIQQPDSYMKLDGQLMYVHAINKTDNLIYKDGKKLYFDFQGSSVDLELSGNVSDDNTKITNAVLSTVNSVEVAADVTVQMEYQRTLDHDNINPLAPIGSSGVKSKNPVSTGIDAGGLVICSAFTAKETRYKMAWMRGESEFKVYMKAGTQVEFSLEMESASSGNSYTLNFNLPLEGTATSDGIQSFTLPFKDDTISNVSVGDGYAVEKVDSESGMTILDTYDIDVAVKDFFRIEEGSSVGTLIRRQIDDSYYKPTDTMPALKGEGNAVIQCVTAYSSIDEVGMKFTSTAGKEISITTLGLESDASLTTEAEGSIILRYNESLCIYYDTSKIFDDEAAAATWMDGISASTTITKTESLTIESGNNQATKDVDMTVEEWNAAGIASVKASNEDTVRYSCTLLEAGYSQSKSATTENTTSNLIREFDCSINEINSVGRTLIVNTDDGLAYFLWKNNKYVYMGSQIPEPQMQFYLSSYAEGEGTHEPGYKEVSKDTRIEKANFLYKLQYASNNCINDKDSATTGAMVRTTYYPVKINTNGKENFNNLVFGSYAANKKEIAKDGGFCLPFFVRYGVELFDGSVTMLSAPKLMFPCIHKNTIGLRETYSMQSMGFMTKYSHLYYKQFTEYSGWEDVVSNIVIYVSRGIEVYDLTSDAILKPVGIGTGSSSIFSNFIEVPQITNTIEPVFDGIEDIDNEKGVDKYHELGDTNASAIDCTARNIKPNIVLSMANGMILKATIARGFGDDDYYNPQGPYILMQQRGDADYTEDIKNTSIFYHVADIKPNKVDTKVSDWHNLKDIMTSNTLVNLETRQSIKHDDYYSHTIMTPGRMVTQNRRLNLFDVKRTFYAGFDAFMGYEAEEGVTAQTYTYTAYVTIETDSGTKVIKNTWKSMELLTKDAMWFYYPDPRAKFITLNVDGQGCILDNAPLEEHKGLNGAYYFSGVPTGSDYWTKADAKNLTEESSAEIIKNYLIQSEVDDPYAFNASSYMKIGEGNILGMAALTTALSNDAYAVATTIVFTTKGIWAAQVGNDGTYTGVTPPFSREVCSNPESITMTDRMVFFVSKKGLMCITGTQEDSVICVSNQLSGNGKSNFLAFLEACKIAYDYRSRKLILYQENSVKVWIYDIASQTFATKEMYLDKDEEGQAVKIQTAVANYPDYIIQDDSNNLCSLYNKKQRDVDGKLYSGEVTTRPMKLGETYSLKSIRQLEAYSMLSDGGTCQIEVFASNDLRKWFQIDSIKGSPFKFFKLHYIFNNVRAKDTYTGTLLSYQTRRDYKIR